MRSMASDMRELTMPSMYESRAWRMEMGRLSVVPGLSWRIRPVVLRDVGRVRVVRMSGIS